MEKYRPGEKVGITVSFDNSRESKVNVILAKPHPMTLQPWIVSVTDSTGKIVSSEPRSACLVPLAPGDGSTSQSEQVKAKIRYEYIQIPPGQTAEIKFDLSVILPSQLSVGQYKASIRYEGRDIGTVDFIVE